MTHSSQTTSFPFAVVGCDFRTAPSFFRELLSSSAEDRHRLSQQLRRIDPKAGFLCLETCNRVEWIVSTEQPMWLAEVLAARMLHRWKLGTMGDEPVPTPRIWRGQDAIEHVFRVVVGLESLAVGEAQIAGQFQDGLNRARTEKTISPLLNRLGTAAGRLAQAAYQLGFRADHRRGIHGHVTQYILAHRPRDVETCHVGIAGMGVMGRKAAQILEEIPGFAVSRWNRTEKNNYRPLQAMGQSSDEFDILVLATGASRALFTSANTLGEKREKPLLVLDIGHPRQATTELQQDPRVLYRGIDDFVAESFGMEPEWTPSLRRVMEEELDDFLRRCRERDWGHLLGRIHQSRHRFLYERLGQFLEENFGELEPSRRKILMEEMGGIMREYAHDVHEALHEHSSVHNEFQE